MRPEPSWPVVSDLTLLLPAELLEDIFSLLPHRSLQAATLVCRRWREVAEVPWLWTWLLPLVHPANLSAMPEVLASRRLEAVTSLRAIIVSDQLLEAVLLHPRLREVDLAHTDLRPVCPRLLAAALTSLSSACLQHTLLTGLQATALFTAITGGSSSLRKLHIGSTNLASVEPDLLARAICSLEEVSLAMEVATSQATSSYLARGGDTGLKTLAMEGDSLVSVAFITVLTGQQLQAVFEELASSSSALRRLDVRGTSLARVDSRVLARAVARLAEADISDTSLSPVQAETVVLAISLGPGQRKVNLGENNLSSVEPAVLARAVARLHRPNLLQASLTGEQIDAVLETLQPGMVYDRLYCHERDPCTSHGQAQP